MLVAWWIKALRPPPSSTAPGDQRHCVLRRLNCSHLSLYQSPKAHLLALSPPEAHLSALSTLEATHLCSTTEDSHPALDIEQIRSYREVAGQLRFLTSCIHISAFGLLDNSRQNSSVDRAASRNIADLGSNPGSAPFFPLLQCFATKACLTSSALSSGIFLLAHSSRARYFCRSNGEVTHLGFTCVGCRPTSKHIHLNSEPHRVYVTSYWTYIGIIDS